MVIINNHRDDNRDIIGMIIGIVTMILMISWRYTVPSIVSKKTWLFEKSLKLAFSN